jgi:hypothetical protein
MMEEAAPELEEQTAANPVGSADEVALVTPAKGKGKGEAKKLHKKAESGAVGGQRYFLACRAQSIRAPCALTVRRDATRKKTARSLEAFELLFMGCFLPSKLLDLKNKGSRNWNESCGICISTC